MRTSAVIGLAFVTLAACNPTDEEVPTSIVPDPPSMDFASLGVECPEELYAGQTKQCTATAYDVFGGVITDPLITSSQASWSSSAPSVAAVDQYGNVTGISPSPYDSLGIFITATYDGVSAQSSLMWVKNPSHITLSPTSKIMLKGSQHAFTAVAYDRSGSTALNDVAFTWTTDNSSVATVNSNGVVTAVDAGTTLLRVAAGGVSATATVYVQLQPETVVLSGPTYAENQSVTINATPSPDSTYHFTWYSKTCEAGGTCESTYTQISSGYNLKSVTAYISRSVVFRSFRVEMRKSPGTLVLDTDTHTVMGAGIASGGCGGDFC